MTEKPSKEKTISLHYAELNKYGQNGEWERALKSANKILGLAPHEFEAFHCKMVCLIELNKFEEAISLINKKPEFLKDLIFEKAYCYYRNNQYELALKTINDFEGELDFRVKELRTQVLYRLEDFDKAASSYKELIKNSDDDYEDERYTNLTASLVYSDAEQLDNLDELKENSYELCFNKACLLINRELYAEAEKKLKQCEKMCIEMLEEEDSSEEETDIELAIIRIQLAYVYQNQGRFKEALQLYTSNLKLKLDDIALVAVASNNVVSINKDQNLFDSKKKMKAALNDQLKHKLPSQQRKYIALNNAILSYYINQADQCEKICQQIEETWPDLKIHTVILRTLNFVKNNKFKEGVKILSEFKPNGKDEELLVKLTLAQYYLQEGDRKKACEIMENLGENTYKPAIVGALTTLYLGMGEEKTALRVFEKSVDWYKKNRVKGDLTSMFRQAAEFHIKNGHAQVAANSLEELLKSNKGDKKIVAQLILACSQFDLQRAIKLSSDLPSISELSKDVDLEALQVTQSSAVNTKKSPAVKQDSQPGTPNTDPQKKRKHKKRKGKLPKNYIEGAVPDPERWLPKYERSGYRKKRDRRVKEVIKGSQGQASGQADQYDFTQHVEAMKKEEDSPIIEPSPRVHNIQKKQQKGKKGKRR